MKKYVLSALVLVSFAGYSIYTRSQVAGSTSANLRSTIRSLIPIEDGEGDRVVAPTSFSTHVATATVIPTSSAPIATKSPSTGKYKDGTYTGSVADAVYGNIQVKVIITGGKISDVIFLQYPNDRNTSIEINTQAMPYLKQEAISAQSAKVNIVSGATDSSIAFRESLTVALSQAL